MLKGCQGPHSFRDIRARQASSVTTRTSRTTLLRFGSTSSLQRTMASRYCFFLCACLVISFFSSPSTAILSSSSTCVRQPENVQTSKTPGDNGYRLKISGNPDKYFPGEVYTGSHIALINSHLCAFLMGKEWGD